MDHLTDCFTCRLLKTRLPWFPKHIEIAPRQRFFFMSTYIYLQALTQRGEGVHVWESKEKEKHIGNTVSSSLSPSGLDQKISLQQRVEKSLADILQHLSFWSWDGAKEAHRRTQTSQHQKHSSRVSQSTTLRRLEVRSRNSTLIKAHSRLLQKVTTRNERWWSRGGSNSWKHTLRTSERFPKPFHPSFHRPPPPYSHSWMNEGRTREEGPYPFKSTTTTTLPPAAALAAGKRQRHPPKNAAS